MPGPSKWRRRELSVAVVFVGGEGVESGGDGNSSAEDDEGEEGEEEEEEVEKDDHGEVAVDGLAANGGGDKDAPGVEADAPVDDNVLRE